MEFILIDPPATIISTHNTLIDRKDHEKLLQEAKIKKLLIYYTEIIINIGYYTAKQPYILDEESYNNYSKIKLDVSEKAEKKLKKKPVTEAPKEKKIEGELKEKKTDISGDEIICPYCDLPLSSTSGRTLHIKNKHPEKLEEYKSGSTKKKEITKDTINCPYCDLPLSSTSGRTLHIKNKHPEKLEEYYENMGRT